MRHVLKILAGLVCFLSVVVNSGYEEALLPFFLSLSPFHCGLLYFPDSPLLFLRWRCHLERRWERSSVALVGSRSGIVWALVPAVSFVLVCGLMPLSCEKPPAAQPSLLVSSTSWSPASPSLDPPLPRQGDKVDVVSSRSISPRWRQCMFVASFSSSFLVVSRQSCRVRHGGRFCSGVLCCYLASSDSGY